jgi:hypothetical protein
MGPGLHGMQTDEVDTTSGALTAGGTVDVLLVALKVHVRGTVKLMRLAYV